MAWNWISGQSIADQRLAAADIFSKEGVVLPISGETGCTTSSQCASGYSCKGGQCVKSLPGGGGGGGTSSFPGGRDCGGDDMGGDWGDNSSGASDGGVGGCAKPVVIGPGSTGCTTATCGQGTYYYGEDSTSCDKERCCRNFATESGVNVNCYFGKCPGQTGDRCGSGYASCGPGLVCQNGYCVRVRPCNRFCDSYYESNGVHAAHCGERDVCDECTECTGSFEGWHYCAEKASQPCHCSSSNLNVCEICNNDGTVSTGNCSECCEIVNKPCSCGTTVSVKTCQPVGTTGPTVCNLAQDAAAAECAKQCETAIDPCAGICESKTVTEDGPCPGNPTAPEGADGHKTTWTGCIEADGKHTTLYDDCDLTNVPEGCGECDCNCHDDCGICDICGEDGICRPDPDSASFTTCNPPPNDVICTFLYSNGEDAQVVVSAGAPVIVTGTSDNPVVCAHTDGQYTQFNTTNCSGSPGASPRVCGFGWYPLTYEGCSPCN